MFPVCKNLKSLEGGNLSSSSTKLKQKLRFASNKTMPRSVSSNQRRVVDEIEKRSFQQLHNLKANHHK